MTGAATATTATTATLLDAALDYARRGWSVFPLHGIIGGRCTCGMDCGKKAGKHPRITDWPDQATTDPATIQRQWERWPDANIGIATGVRSGLAVVDVDPRHDGDETLRELEAQYGALAPTVEALTGGGGRHIIYRYPGYPVKTGVGALGPGLDSKADGGYIVAPPSLHLSGRRYCWEVSSHPDDVAIADAPAWLLNLLQPESGKEQRMHFTIPETIREGERNDMLYRTARSLKTRCLSLPAVVAAVRIENDARCHPPLSGAEVDQIVTHAFAQQDRPEYAGNGRATTRAEAEAVWPEPKPIVAALHAVPPFDGDTLLPDVLRAWIMDEADRMPCPPDFIAVAALVALGTIIGARCAIKPKCRDNWLIIPNLWGGIVGPPSDKKSPAIAAALQPLDRLIARAKEAHKTNTDANEVATTIHKAMQDAIEARIKAAAKASQGDLDSLAKELQAHRRQAPTAPTPQRYKTNDSTIEKLGELLAANPAGLLVLRDELVGLVASWEREGREGDRAFFLEAWNGTAAYDTDRIVRGSIPIKNLCLSIFGGIQPDKLIAYLEHATHALANDGMLQRFQMMVYPDHRAWEWRDRTPDVVARERVFAVFETLADFDPVAWGAAPVDDFAKFPHFNFDEAAQEIFIEWSIDLHLVRLPAEEHPIIAQHLAKYDKLFPSLAHILHLADCAATGQRGPVTAEAALRAAAWCDYLEAHARRCYGLLVDDGLRAAQALAEKVQQGKLSDGFTARDVRRNQWRYLTGDREVGAALDWLEEEGWLRSAYAGTGAGGGRPTRVYRINPSVKSGNKSGGDHGELA